MDQAKASGALLAIKSILKIKKDSFNLENDSTFQASDDPYIIYFKGQLHVINTIEQILKGVELDGSIESNDSNAKLSYL